MPEREDKDKIIILLISGLAGITSGTIFYAVSEYLLKNPELASKSIFVGVGIFTIGLIAFSLK
jgi:hypothetical protein